MSKTTITTTTFDKIVEEVSGIGPNDNIVGFDGNGVPFTWTLKELTVVLDGQPKENKPWMRTFTLSVTPSLAKWLLARNNNNRDVPLSHPSLLASDMNTGRWMNMGVPIIFDWNGLIIDGQNRLKAVLLSKKTENFAISVGAKLPLEAVIVALPSATALTNPFASTSATASFELS